MPKMPNLAILGVGAGLLWLLMREKKVPGGGRPSPCPPMGDLDGDGLITRNDERLMRSPVIWMKPVDPANEMSVRANLKGYGTINLTDWGLMKAFLNGDIDTFPACNLR